MRDSEVKITILIWGAFLCRTRKSCAQPHPGLIHPAPGKTAGAPATGRWRSGSHVPLRAPASAGATPACQSSAGLPGFSRSCTARPGACRRDRGAAGPEALPPTASAPAPSRSGSAAPPTGQSRPMHCRAAGRRGPAALPAQRRDKPRAAASGHSRAAAAGPAPRRGARGRACAENPDNTPPPHRAASRSSVSSGTRCGRTASSMTAICPCSGHAGMRAPPSGRKPRPSTAARPVNVAISLQFAAKYTGTGNRQTSPCVL